MNRGRMSFGMWLVFAGILILLTNLGWLDRTFWIALAELWPLLLILFGLHLVLSRTIFWLIPVLAGVVFAGAVFTFGADIPFLPWTNAEREVREFAHAVEPETERLTIEMDVDAIGLDLKRGEPGDISGRLASYYDSSTVSHEITENRDRVVFKQSLGPRPWFSFLNRLSRWEVLVPPDVPVDLNLESGAGNFDLDFRGLDVRSVVLRGGAAFYDLCLDEVGTHTSVDVDNGVAGVHICVPREVGLRVSVEGLTFNNLASAGLQNTNGIWQTPGYEQSERTIEVDISLGVGYITVTRTK